MHLSMYCPIPIRPKWGFTGGIDTKALPHYGAFDKGFLQVGHVKFPCCNWGLCGGCIAGGFDIFSFPLTIGHLTSNPRYSLTINWHNIEGVGQYIDRWISIHIITHSSKLEHRYHGWTREFPVYCPHAGYSA